MRKSLEYNIENIHKSYMNKLSFGSFQCALDKLVHIVCGPGLLGFPRQSYVQTPGQHCYYILMDTLTHSHHTQFIRQHTPHNFCLTLWVDNSWNLIDRKVCCFILLHKDGLNWQISIRRFRHIILQYFIFHIPKTFKTEGKITKNNIRRYI